jgi:hypothetical protein
MNGTSAAAPHIAGLIALIFEYAKKHSHPKKSLSADQISAALKAGAKAGGVTLRFNRHQKVDARVPATKKQEHVKADLLVSDRANGTETMNRLPL